MDESESYAEHILNGLMDLATKADIQSRMLNDENYIEMLHNRSRLHNIAMKIQQLTLETKMWRQTMMDSLDIKEFPEWFESHLNSASTIRMADIELLQLSKVKIPVMVQHSELAIAMVDMSRFGGLI